VLTLFWWITRSGKQQECPAPPGSHARFASASMYRRCVAGSIERVGVAAHTVRNPAIAKNVRRMAAIHCDECVLLLRLVRRLFASFVENAHDYASGHTTGKSSRQRSFRAFPESNQSTISARIVSATACALGKR
jgi:hypothetical protein